jgi:hypothetical protein
MRRSEDCVVDELVACRTKRGTRGKAVMASGIGFIKTVPKGPHLGTSVALN